MKTRFSVIKQTFLQQNKSKLNFYSTSNFVSEANMSFSKSFEILRFDTFYNPTV